MLILLLLNRLQEKPPTAKLLFRAPTGASLMKKFNTSWVVCILAMVCRAVAAGDLSDTETTNRIDQMLLQVESCAELASRCGMHDEMQELSKANAQLDDENKRLELVIVELKAACKQDGAAAAVVCPPLKFYANRPKPNNPNTSLHHDRKARADAASESMRQPMDAEQPLVIMHQDPKVQALFWGM